MVTTRRAAANAIAATNASTVGAWNMQTTKVTNHFVVTTAQTIHNAAVILKPSASIDNIPPLSLNAKHGLIPAYPFDSKYTENMPMSPADRKGGAQSQHGSRPDSICQTLAPRPHGLAGSFNNPINMLEDTPPRKSRRESTRPPKRKYRRQSEPHKFIDKGYRDLYNYRQSWATPAPLQARGTTFTGHISQDRYRAKNAMSIAPPRKPNEAYGPAIPLVPFEVQFPKSTQFLAENPVPNVPSHAHSPYHGPLAPMTVSAPVAAPSEDMLRKKAVHYVREFYRRTPRERALSNTHPDEASDSEPEEPTMGQTRSSTASTEEPSAASSTVGIGSAQVSIPAVPSRTTKPVSVPEYGSGDRGRNSTVFRDADRVSSISQIPADNLDIIHLVEHTSLLTTLLQRYPSSQDQRGLRQDIAMLVAVQNQHFEAWTKREVGAARHQRKHHISQARRNAASRASHGAPPRLQDYASEIVRDEEMRDLLSARASLWQDGSGVGVADVFSAQSCDEDDDDEEGGRVCEGLTSADA